MASHNELGKLGETLASAYLQQSGFFILHTNWRYEHCEIDIIATKKEWLHFIEVKTRKSSRHGHPEESVDKKKFTNMVRAADAFLHQNTAYRWIQYDILSIIINSKKDPEYFLISDVYL